jgi:hypothetical protein
VTWRDRNKTSPPAMYSRAVLTMLAPPSPAHHPQNHPWEGRPQHDSLAALGTAMGGVLTPRRRQVMLAG